MLNVVLLLQFFVVVVVVVSSWPFVLLCSSATRRPRARKLYGEKDEEKEIRKGGKITLLPKRRRNQLLISLAVF
jgi:hypothetical protein